jgi:hypothetical protein
MKYGTHGLFAWWMLCAAVLVTYQGYRISALKQFNSQLAQAYGEQINENEQLQSVEADYLQQLHSCNVVPDAMPKIERQL